MMKKLMFKIAYKLKLKKLACKISPSLYVFYESRVYKLKRKPLQRLRGRNRKFITIDEMHELYDKEFEEFLNTHSAGGKDDE